MKITVQKAIYKRIQKGVYRYECDNCGRSLGVDNPKMTFYSGKLGGESHVCRYRENCNPFFIQPKSGKALEISTEEE